MTEEILSAVSSEVFSVWFLIGAALVFWMQAGFAMVEAGFTRAKNTGNIIMKNLMDFCIGTCSIYSDWFQPRYWVKIWSVSLVSPDLIFSPATQTLTGPTSYSTWYSVRRLQPSFPAPWQKEPNSYPIVFILQ